MTLDPSHLPAHPTPSADGAPERTTIALAVCTYRRNDPLRVLLKSVLVAAEQVRDRAAVGVVVVDDNRDGAAAPVVAEFDGAFELGIHYRQVGKGNISECRNTAVATALEIAEWIAMTDDDCEATPGWLANMLDMQQATGADTVTGPCHLTVPAGSPAWLTDQPFLDEGMFDERDGSEVPTAATHNSMMRSGWLRDHPDVRFDLDLGVVGGEDMVFFGSARRAGMTIRYSAAAAVIGHESAERATYRYRLRSSYWLGNTECVTNLALAADSRTRLLLRGGKRTLEGVLRPVGQLARRRPPQFRFALALTAQGLGLLLGAMGVRKAHH